MKRPPALARGLLRLLPRSHRDFVLGDLEEEYTDRVLGERGDLGAALWFWGQAIRTLGAFVWRRRGSDAGFVAAPFFRETRHALRGLRRRPSFTLVAVATLALGIGATASVFSVADAVLFRSIPGVTRQEELAAVEFTNGGSRMGISLPNLRDLSATPGIVGMASYQPAVVQAGGEGLSARTVWGQIVTGDYFEVLGVRAAMGRLFRPTDVDAAAGAAEVVLSDAFWRATLGADPGIVGGTLRINGTQFDVVGVVEPGFRGVERLDSVDLWLPGSQYVALRHGEGVRGWALDNRSADFFQQTVIRLAPGIAAGEAERRLGATMSRLVEAYPDENRDHATFVPRVRADVGLNGQDRRHLGSTLAVLTGLVLVILLVTCANVANLLVLQAARRREETAVRRVLGAARSQVAFLHFCEALLLAVPAVVLGLGVALLVNRILWSAGLFPDGVVTHVVIDARVFAFAAGTGILTALTFGMLPALLGFRSDIHSPLRDGRRTTSGAATLLQGGLSVVQLSLSLTLVGGALVLARTVANLARIDVGFDPAHVLLFSFDPGPQGYRGADVGRLQRAVLDGAAALPGIERAGISVVPPFSPFLLGVGVAPPAGESLTLLSFADWVTEGHFDVLGMPIVAGRGFTREESMPAIDSRPRVAVLGHSLATRLFGSARRAVGRTMDVNVSGEAATVTVVGVADDVVDGSPRNDQPPRIYLPLPGSSQTFATLVVLTRRPLGQVAADVRRILAGIDPDVPLTAAEAMVSRVAGATARERTLARLAALLAALAILLAGVGLYSVIAYTTAQRTREFGVRFALGATGLRVTRLVLRQALRFGIVGIVCGLVIFRLGTRIIASSLYGVAAMDVPSVGIAAALILVVALAASLTPALGASRMDPAAVLRGH